MLEGPLAAVSDIVDVVVTSTSTHRFEHNTGDRTLRELTDLVLTDPVGVFDALRLDADIYGVVMSDFFRELLREPGARGDVAGEPLSHDGAIMVNEILAGLLGSGIDPRRSCRVLSEA